MTGFAFAKDSAFAVGNRCHMDSYVEVWVIQPSNIDVQQYDLQMLLLDTSVLLFPLVQECVVHLINKQIGFLML